MVMDEKHTVTIKSLRHEADNILHLILEKPDGFRHKPGQAVLFHLTDEGADEEPSPFSPVSLPDADELEFFIKVYPKRDGLTDALEKYSQGDEIEIGNAFGDIRFHEAGTFLAAGTGITPLLAILRNLHAKGKADGNTLYYSESSEEELIAKDLLREILGDSANFILTGDGNQTGRLDRTFLESKIANIGDQDFYVCGPPEFVEDTLNFLRQKGAKDGQLIYEGNSEE